jgi:ubiquinone/menaquinone biosynthesis C-methylase UbiE
MVNLFDTPAKAEGYAKARPPLHARIVERIAVRAPTVLDVGCGAGLSTAPLLRFSPNVYGVDPFPEMLKWAGRIAPGAHFATARAESLPFRDAAFDLITAAGSLNYADPARAFPELRRVLTPDGTLAVYDFNQPDFPYHRPPDGAIKLSPEILSQMDTGFRLVRSEPLDLPVVMTHDEYIAFLKTEVNVPDPPRRENWNLQFRGYIAWFTAH